MSTQPPPRPEAELEASTVLRTEPPGMKRCMDVRNIDDPHEWFDVLGTGAGIQTAVMDLKPGGGESGRKTNEHPRSEQVLFVVEGEVEAEIGEERRTLRAGDSVIVPRDVPHRFSNKTGRTARTFNVYSPPAY